MLFEHNYFSLCFCWGIATNGCSLQYSTAALGKIIPAAFLAVVANDNGLVAVRGMSCAAV